MTFGNANLKIQLSMNKTPTEENTIVSRKLYKFKANVGPLNLGDETLILERWTIKPPPKTNEVHYT